MTNTIKAYRGTAEGFTAKAEQLLKDTISSKHFNHSIKIESIKDNVATLKIHKFKESKGRPAKDYKATIEITKMWRENISAFKNFKII